ncbi:hypothetical protein niasHT_019199 [Heterodera trifolii]|uniref:Uncharacterized protein n=1 Tax=Heterodera trifolii TaxID=157864 RepID=A0ABD2L0K4_9BILA
MPQDFISATNIGTPENEGLMTCRAVELLLVGESHGDEGDVEEATINARELLRKRGRRKERGRDRERKAIKRAVGEVIDEATDAAKVFIEANWNAFEKVVEKQLNLNCSSSGYSLAFCDHNYSGFSVDFCSSDYSGCGIAFCDHNSCCPSANTTAPHMLQLRHMSPEMLFRLQLRPLQGFARS